MATRHARFRCFDQKHFGDSGYANEELVADICADLEITLETREDYAACIVLH
jgi:hypothetical protein